ncbi:hypothetical protein PAT3040_04441 [Paenibacillus agaridevorans]|uniref:Uncharacterized protein n=1 Tax=Paenibacillus agaridevorans TaxID=171404 RepID=A0A2R5F1Z9_9BACL|nr:hypothetical protein PAT3040_04441 [Paenibacillus agaridevorans]
MSKYDRQGYGGSHQTKVRAVLGADLAEEQHDRADVLFADKDQGREQVVV